jgi:hypothetical protein
MLGFQCPGCLSGIQELRPRCCDIGGAQTRYVGAGMVFLNDKGLAYCNSNDARPAKVERDWNQFQPV